VEQDDIPDLSNVTNASIMFEDATSFNGDLSGWDTQNITNMAAMFKGAAAFVGNGIENWDTGNVRHMQSMFSEASVFDANLANWNIQNIERMDSMFDNSGLSTDNYDATLVGWRTVVDGEGPIPLGISLGAQGILLCADSDGADARDFLENEKGWIIDDGGTLICGD
ncbi:MAG: BspA family leucine-rich repeat surface protein, partial [Bacteroidota bacterium]